MERENDKSRRERLVAYAVKEFAVAMRSILTAAVPLHSFRLSDKPPFTVVVMVLPSDIADAYFDQMDALLKAGGVHGLGVN